MPQRCLSELLKRRGPDLALLCVTILFFMAFFWRTLFCGEFLLANDPMFYSYPLRMLAWGMIKEGTLPLWTPTLFSGYPLLSMAQLGIGYPLTWGYLFLPGHWAEQIYVLAPYLLAPAFTYAYARVLGLSPVASLLAGLGFGYGGLMFSPIGVNGMPTNSMMWLPLVLIAIERARRSPFASSLLLGTFAYSMSVLTGIGQGFVYAGTVALAYAAFIGFATSPAAHRKWQQFKPLGVAAGSIILATGVAAFQMWETIRAVRLSVRSKLSYERFSEGSFPFELAWKSVIDPIHHVGDVTTYISPLVLLLAFASVLFALREKRRDLRIFFWLATAILAFILILGENTPIYRLFYRIPIINSFRVPSRHSFEWTFALSLMAAYGWDAVQSRMARSERHRRLSIALSALFLAISVFAAFRWWRAMRLLPYLETDLRVEYLWWKTGFTLLLLIAVWQGWRVIRPRWRSVLLTSAVAVATFIEPSICLARWVGMFPEKSARFSYLSPVTRMLSQFPPDQNRVYTQVALGNENHHTAPQIDSLNWTALAGLHNVAGYEPMVMERYTRALNSSDWNDVSTAPFLRPDPSLFETKSHVLDLLNVRFIAAYSDLAPMQPEKPLEKEGIEFSSHNAETDLSLQSPAVFSGGGAEADTLAIVTAMAISTHIADGVPVADISIHTTDGRAIKRVLRAGDDTSEWAHEKPDVKAVIKHKLAPVFDSRPADEQNSFPSLRYLARINLGERTRVQRIELVKTRPDVGVVMWQTSLFDSATRRSTALLKLDAHRWEMIYNRDGAIVLRNLRTLPRAWLVTEAEAVDQIEAWARIRGQSQQPFDPRRIALLELEPRKMPSLSRRPLSPDSYARVADYEPNRLVIETNTNEQAVLVISEMHYPGWVATIDGVKSPIHQTDFLLRGMIVPEGKHRIEMRYLAPGARNGAIISLLAISLVVVIGIRARRK